MLQQKKFEKSVSLLLVSSSTTVIMPAYSTRSSNMSYIQSVALYQCPDCDWSFQNQNLKTTKMAVRLHNKKCKRTGRCISINGEIDTIKKKIAGNTQRSLDQIDSITQVFEDGKECNPDGTLREEGKIANKIMRKSVRGAGRHRNAPLQRGTMFNYIRAMEAMGIFVKEIKSDNSIAIDFERSISKEEIRKLTLQDFIDKLGDKGLLGCVKTMSASKEYLTTQVCV